MMRAIYKPMLTTVICLSLMAGNVIADENLQAKNKKSIQHAFEMWVEGTGSPFDMLAPDAKWTIVGNAPVSRTYTSRQEFLDLVIKPFNARMQQRLIPTLKGVYADGDMVIALFDADAIARDRKPYHNSYTWYMRLKGKQIVEVVAFFDTIELTELWNRVTP